MSDRIPIVEVSPLSSSGTDIVFVPVEDIDDFLSDVQDEYDLGLGELTAELGAVKVKAKASVNVKAAAKKPPAKKPAPKKPAPKKPVAVAKKPATKAGAKPKPATKPSAKKPVAKATIKASVKIPKITVKAKAASKVASISGKATIKAKAKAAPVNVKQLAKSASNIVSKLSTQLKKPLMAVKTQVKSGTTLKVVPKATTIKPLQVVAKVAALAPSIKALPVSAKQSLAIAAAAPAAKLLKLPPKPAQKPVPPLPASPKTAAKATKPIGSLMTSLKAVSAPKTCPCIVATKKPAQAAVSPQPTLAAKYSQRIIDAAKLTPEEFQREVLLFLQEIEGNCTNETLRNKLRRLSTASGVKNVQA